MQNAKNQQLICKDLMISKQTLHRNLKHLLNQMYA